MAAPRSPVSDGGALAIRNEKRRLGRVSRLKMQSQEIKEGLALGAAVVSVERHAEKEDPGFHYVRVAGAGESRLLLLVF